MLAERLGLNYGLRNDLCAFIDYTFHEVSPADRVEITWYLEAIAHQLTLCAERKVKRLIINVPPRHGKSISASVAFAAWLLGRNPAERVVGISYGSEVAMKFARDTKRVMESRWYRSAFPGTRLSARTATHDFQTTRQGGRYTTSIDGALTGLGGDIFLIDDPNQASDARSATARQAVIDWYGGVLLSRLNNARNGVVIIIQQRVHEDDLTGYLLATEPDEWAHLNLPAIAVADEAIPLGSGCFHRRRVGDILDPSREDLRTLEQKRRIMGSQSFSAQYQQEPVPNDGEIVKWSWFKTYQTAPDFERGDRFVQSWDTASKAGELNDFSVCTTWLIKGRDYYLVDVWRGRVDFPDLRRQVYALNNRYGPDVLLIEDKGSGTQLIQQLREEDDPHLPRPIAFVPTADKITRMAAQAVRIEQGHVFVPQDASFMGHFRRELLQFPNGKHDDQVDSVSQFLEWVTARPDTGNLIIIR